VAVWIEIKKKQPPYTMELVSVFPIFLLVSVFLFLLVYQAQEDDNARRKLPPLTLICGHDGVGPPVYCPVITKDILEYATEMYSFSCKNYFAKTTAHE
jgi:hypothetical protein